MMWIMNPNAVKNHWIESNSLITVSMQWVIELRDRRKGKVKQSRYRPGVAQRVPES